MSILDQEESKKFLCGKPEDKYRFFMKATDLERMDVHYAETIEKLKELEGAKAVADDSLQPLQETVEAARKRWKQHDAVNKLEKKVREAQYELAWALHAEADSAYQESVVVRARVVDNRRGVACA